MVDPQKIWSSTQLPTLPSVAVRLLEISQNPESEISEVTDVIKSDPAITAKILKSTNSAYFGFRSEVTSLDRAVPLLGTTVVTSLALSFSLSESAMQTGPLAEHYKSYWMQSVIQAVAAELLAERAKIGLSCDHFLAGLLTDLGRLAMLKVIPDEYLPVIESANKERLALYELEKATLGCDHVDIGVKLMENWQLPPALIKAIRFQHAGVATIKEQENTPEYELIKTVSLASSIGECFCAENKGPEQQRLAHLLEEFYGGSEEDVETILSDVKTKMADAGELFDVDVDSLGDPGDLMAQANEHLAQVAMKEHVASTQAAAKQEVAEQQKKELETQNQNLQQQVLHDALTQIYNRRFFDESIANEIARCRREALSIGVIFSDIDRFKQLNDTYGHQFGDLVLQKVAAAFKEVTRQSDIVARYGGEEFVILVVQPTPKGLAKVAERVRARIEAEEIFFEEDTRVPVTISLGAVIAIPERVDDDLTKRLVAAADEAMYDSKENGRNQVHTRSLIPEDEQKIAQVANGLKFSRWLVGRQVFDIRTISSVLVNMERSRARFGDISVNFGYLNTNQVEMVAKDQETSHQRFGRIAIRLGLMTADQCAHVLSSQQESPQGLKRMLVDSGLLEAEYAESLLNEYNQSVVAPLRNQTPTAVPAN